MVPCSHGRARIQTLSGSWAFSHRVVVIMRLNAGCKTEPTNTALGSLAFSIVSLTCSPSPASFVVPEFSTLYLLCPSSCGCCRHGGYSAHSNHRLWRQRTRWHSIIRLPASRSSIGQGRYERRNSEGSHQRHRRPRCQYKAELSRFGTWPGSGVR
jgi:hypothetical protein